jgi:formyl-CoA transferase/CoA:oxalate CoA-transferase
VLAVGNDDQWRRFCAVAELPEDPRSRPTASGDELRRGAAIHRRPPAHPAAQHWIERLNAAGVPCGSVRSLQELFADPQIQARQMVAEIEHTTIGALRVLGLPVKLSDTPGAVRTPPPRLGEHTDTVLHDFGFSDDAIAELRRQKVI